MLIFVRQSLAFIAVPKTGTTAIEMALRSRADIVFARRFKHITAQRFHTRIAPLLADTFGLTPERFAVMRHPEEQIRSWFRYRRREERRGHEKSTRNMTFDDFVEAVISDDPPPVADIGSQRGMLTSPRGELLVHHLFAHERPLRLHAFLADRFGEGLELKPRNVSPRIDAPLDPAVRARLRAAREEEFTLYERLVAAGGYLRTDVP